MDVFPPYSPIGYVFRASEDDESRSMTSFAAQRRGQVEIVSTSRRFSCIGVSFPGGLYVLQQLSPRPLTIIACVFSLISHADCVGGIFPGWPARAAAALVSSPHAYRLPPHLPCRRAFRPLRGRAARCYAPAPLLTLLYRALLRFGSATVSHVASRFPISRVVVSRHPRRDAATSSSPSLSMSLPSLYDQSASRLSHPNLHRSYPLFPNVSSLRPMLTHPFLLPCLPPSHSS